MCSMVSLYDTLNLQLLQIPVTGAKILAAAAAAAGVVVVSLWKSTKARVLTLGVPQVQWGVARLSLKELAGFVHRTHSQIWHLQGCKISSPAAAYLPAHEACN